MSMRFTTSWRLGLAVALALGVGHTASAQTDTSHAKPHSTRRAHPHKKHVTTAQKKITPSEEQAAPAERIKIVKESPGEVAPPPDTTHPPAAIPAPPPPPVREETPPPPPPPAPVVVHRIPGFFIGAGGGLAFAGNGSSSNEVTLGVQCIPGTNGDPSLGVNRAGYSVAVPFGFQPIGSPLGVRFDVGYSQYQSHGTWLASDGTTGFFRTRPQIWTVDADAKLRLLNGSRLSPYVIGGPSWGHFRTVVDRTGSTPIDSQNQSWHSAWGYNVGGGLEYMFRRTGVFVESRYFHLNGATGFNSVSHVPVIVGVTWY